MEYDIDSNTYKVLYAKYLRGLMEYDIDSNTYKVLYAKYLNRNRTIEMVDLAGDLKGKKVLDLCSGGCRLSEEVLRRKPKTITAVDGSYKMLQPLGDSSINKICMGVDMAFANLAPGITDAIFCQQGINYWFQPEHAKTIKSLLAPKGVFIFNTFNQKPSEIPFVKSYLFHGKKYVEVSWLVKNMVKHIQIREGMDPHYTEFRWIPPVEFQEAFLAARLKIDVHNNGKTDIYVCKK